MDQDKLEQVIAAVLDSHYLPLEITSADAKDFIMADWSEGDEHIEWLNTASVGAIVDWVIAGMR